MSDDVEVARGDEWLSPSGDAWRVVDVRDPVMFARIGSIAGTLKVSRAELAAADGWRLVQRADADDEPVEHLRILGAALGDEIDAGDLAAAADAAFFELADRGVDLDGVAPVINEAARKRLQADRSPAGTTAGGDGGRSA